MAAAAAATTPMMEKASAGLQEIISAFTASEARFFDEERYSEAEIRRSLNDTMTEKKIDGMKRILAAVSNGRDASALFPDVVKNVSFSSLELKKLIYIYLVQYAENNRDLALLSINSFQKDLSDRSQLVRASALRAMASIRVLEVIQLVMVAVKNASNDMSAYVRKTAAQCMTKVYSVDPDQFFDLRTLLLKLMGDHEVQVVGSAVMAFHHICVLQSPRLPADASPEPAAADAADAGDPGGGFLAPDEAVRLQLALLHPLFRRLCQDMLLMDLWAQQCCIDILLRYCRCFFASPYLPPKAVATGGDDESAADASGEAPAKPSEPEVSADLQSFLKALKLLLCSASQGVTLACAVSLCYLAPPSELSTIVRPLLRCLRHAPQESQEALLSAIRPIIEVRPDLLRPNIREFLVQSFDFPAVKALKLKILEYLVDETNVQLVLRELQAYVSWHSHPRFVQLSVQSIAHVALKISSVADACMRGLVKMLDSKCEALSCEAVVALRALLQQRQQSAESGLGTVLPHLVRYLEDLAAPSARASVVWIIGHYQREVPKLAPDVVRKLAASFPSERQEVKQQVLGLGLKVWAFHALRLAGVEVQVPQEGDAAAETKPAELPLEESTRILPRLEAIVDYVYQLAYYDTAWDVRDTARALMQIKKATKEALEAGTKPEEAEGLGGLGLWYSRACVTGTPILDGVSGALDATAAQDPTTPDGHLESKWVMGSLAQALDFPLDTYRPLPPWAEESTPDEIRTAKVEAPSAVAKPRSLCSDNVGQSQHMEKRVQAPSNITNMPVVQNLEDLDLFYSDEAPKQSAKASAPATRASPAAPPATLEQVRLAGGASQPAAQVGTAVFGEDDESEEEQAESESDDDDDSWKYCQEAASRADATSTAPSSSPAPTTEASPAPAEPAAEAAQAPEPAQESAESPEAQ